MVDCGRHELIGDEELAPLYELLLDENPQIRHAVGDMVYSQRLASGRLTALVVRTCSMFHLDCLTHTYL